MSDRSTGKTANQPPVSAHPAFPVIVALWFAALLGIGSMVLPLDMFERFSVASGLADAYSAAQPPLGATARIVVAAIAALIGGAAGVFVAGRVRAAHAPRTTGRRAAALQPSQTRFSAKRPISAHEELGEGGLDADDDAPSVREAPIRRRALAVTDDSAPSDFLSFAPLPGRSANESDEPLDLVAFEEPAAAEFAEEAVAETEASAEARFEQPAEDFGSSILSTPASRPFDYAFVPGSPATGEHDVDLSASEQVEEPAPEPVDSPDIEPAASPVGERALGELGMVELVERFALALQRHQATAIEAAAVEPVEAVEAVALAEVEHAEDPHEEPVTAEPQAEEMPAAMELPAALRPFGFEEAELAEDLADVLPDLDLAAALSESRGPFSAPFATALDSGFDEDESEADDDLAEEGYTSLLAMKSPLGHREPVRIEDDDDDTDEDAEPVVVFPGQAVRRAVPVADAPARPFDAPLQRAEHPAAAARHPAADPHATERALREALEKLQRMSGAA